MGEEEKRRLINNRSKYNVNNEKKIPYFIHFTGAIYGLLTKDNDTQGML
jgi:hypothetical protein